MKQQNYINKLIVGLVTLTLVTGVGCGLDNERLKKIGVIIAVSIAAKLIYDMIIDYQSEQISDEKRVIEKYKKDHKKLPNEPVLVSYESNIMPGEVVSAGKKISIVSKLEVVRGSASRNLNIQEKIVIFDNEDNTKELKGLTKVVNEKTKRSGRFENTFTFKLPKGMPQGIYPVKTMVLIDGKPFEPTNSQMQLVINDSESLQYELLALN